MDVLNEQRLCDLQWSNVHLEKRKKSLAPIQEMLDGEVAINELIMHSP